MSKQFAFLLISVGGFGAGVLQRFRAIAGSRNITNAHVCIIDTDEATGKVARSINAPFFLATARGPNSRFGDDRFETARRFPQHFGRDVQRFLDAFNEEELDLVAKDGGSATRPFVGSIKFILNDDGLMSFHRDQIKAASDLINSNEGDFEIIPIVVGSMSGGTSAAGMPFTCMQLGDDRRRRDLSPDIHQVRKPTIVFLPPYIQAEMQEAPSLRYRALANCYAAIWEANDLAPEQVIEGMTMLHTTSKSGANLSNLKEAEEFTADVLACSIRGHEFIQSRATDSRNLLATDPGRRFKGRAEHARVDINVRLKDLIARSDRPSEG